jgi:hypothetical protein
MRMIGVVLTPLSGACISGDLLLYYSVQWCAGVIDGQLLLEQFNNKQPLRSYQNSITNLKIVFYYTNLILWPSY